MPTGWMIDAHLHLQDPAFDAVREEILETLREIGVRFLAVNSTGPDDWARVAELAKGCEEVRPFYGVHPWRVGELGPGWEEGLRARLEADRSAGIGEAGLDRWIRPHDMATQLSVFAIHLSLAREYRRVLSIHCLRAWGILLERLEQDPPTRPFLLHSYGGPRELVPRFAELGAYFSISGYFFREDKAHKLAVFESVPEDRTLLETDAPDMAPPDALRPYRLTGKALRAPEDGTRQGAEPNHPANLVAIYGAYARWRGLPLDVAARRIASNAATWLERATP